MLPRNSDNEIKIEKAARHHHDILEKSKIMQRKKHSAEFKAKIALEAIKGLKTINEIASEAEVHPTQVTLWKKQLIEEIPTLFTNGRDHKEKSQEDLTALLYQQIGQLKVELDWIKKKSGIVGR
jgi:transposase-like protein